MLRGTHAIRPFIALAALVMLVLATASARAGKREPVDVAVVITDASGTSSAARHATLLVEMERAVRGDKRLAAVDKDYQLALRAGDVPTDVISEARGLVRAGEALLRKQRAADALPRLEAGVRQLETALAWVKKEELAAAQFLLGAARASAGDTRGATETFVALLAWRPEHVADPEIDPAAVIPVWEAAAVKARKLAGGSIAIDSKPDGAMAYVDGRLVGFTPTTAEGLSVGTHYVTLRLPGWGKAVLPVKVSSTSQHDVAATLDRLPEQDELDRLVGELAAARESSQGGAGAARALGELVAAEHVLLLIAPVAGDDSGQFEAVLFDARSGKRLNAAVAAMGEDDPETVFAALRTSLYAGVELRAKPKRPVRKPKPKPAGGRPFYASGWFWGGVTAVGAAIAIPLILTSGDDGPPPLSCPTDTVCGSVVLDF